MPFRNAGVIAALALHLACAACSSGDDAESTTPSAPPPPPPPLPSSPNTPVPVAPSVPNVDGVPNPFAALQAIGAAAQQMGAQGPSGPVVNWRDLVPFLPDTLLNYQAKGDVDGSTTTMQGMQITRVSRSYVAGEERMEVKIVDTSLAPFLRTPFALVGMMQEDSSEGYKKGTTIKGQPAIAEWQKQGRSELHMLAGQRFVIDVEVRSQTPGTAERVADALDISGIIASAAKAVAPAAPAAPTPAPKPGK
jgi:hypothetical protein